MFLTRGVLYHEALWEVWFRSAAGLLPMAALQAADCEAGILEHVRHSCGAKAGASLLQQQHMYSVYVHVGANELGWKGAITCIRCQDKKPIIKAGLRVLTIQHYWVAARLDIV